MENKSEESIQNVAESAERQREGMIFKVIREKKKIP